MKKWGLKILILITMVCACFIIAPTKDAAAATYPAYGFHPLWPVEGAYYIMSGSYYYSNGLHGGIDILPCGKSGRQITAVADGTVVGFVRTRSGFDGKTYGNYIEIKHSINGVKFTSLYAHMSYNSIPSSIKVGSKIKAGAVIGKMGNTGNSYGEHLHFEIHKGAYQSSKEKRGNTLSYYFNNTSLTHDLQINSSSVSYMSKGNKTAKNQAAWIIANCGKTQKSTFSNGESGYKCYVIKVGCEHSYNDGGICTKCSREYPFLDTLDETKAGVYTYVYDTVELKSKPYDDATTSITKTDRMYTFTRVFGSVKNANGEWWYQLPGPCYIEVGKLEYYADLPADFGFHYIPSMSGVELVDGRDFSLKGAIVSAEIIKSIECCIYREGNTGDVAQQYTYIPDSLKMINLRGSDIDEALKFDQLKPGEYMLSFKITDIKGRTETKTCGPFTVIGNSARYCQKPIISVMDVIGGKTVTLTSETPDAVITYQLIPQRFDELSAEEGVEMRYVSPLTLEQTTTVIAFANKDGLETSGTTTASVAVTQLNIPEITTEQTPSGSRMVIYGETGATLKYSTDYGETYQTYSKPLLFTQNTTVIAYAEKKGYVSSEIVETDIMVSAPTTPTLSRVSTATIAQGEAAIVKWPAVSNAISYTVRWYKDGVLVDTFENVTDSGYSYPLNDATSYSVTVEAINAIGSSGESASLSFTAMAPVTVTFKERAPLAELFDWDQQVIQEQQVKYNSSAVRPNTPEHEGCSFDGWSRSFDNLTEDTVIYADYKLESYQVTFIYGENETTRSSYIDYGSAAEPPTESANNSAATGFAFLEWRLIEGDPTSDYSCVKGNMTYIAVYQLATPERPVRIEDVSANLTSKNDRQYYNVSLDLVNLGLDTVDGKVIVALKTTNDKLVDVAMFSVSVGPEETIAERTVNLYSDNVATKVEVAMVSVDGAGRTGGAVATMVEADVAANEGWSNWSATPTGVEGEESRTLYRYRDKQYITGDSATLEGWELYNTTWDWSEWSDYTDTEIIEIDGLQEVRTQVVTVKNAYTQYKYHRYVGTNSSPYDVHFCPYLAKANNGGIWKKDSTDWLNTKYSPTGSQYSHNNSAAHRSAYNCDCPNKTVYKYTVNYNGANRTYYWYTTRTVAAVTKTQYSYRINVPSYEFSKWGDWSEWSAITMSGTDTRQVETKTEYRYWSDSLVEEDQLPGYNATPYQDTISGNLNELGLDLAEQYATVFVYCGRNSDPTQSQLEYIGDVLIGADNSYSFTINTRRQKSQETGDYIVALGMEGATNLINIALLEAEKPQYTVTFINSVDNSVIDTQTIDEGDNAMPPDIPANEGYYFTGWSDGIYDVRQDNIVFAQYEQKEYVVVFVDWKLEKVTLSPQKYGSPLITPDITEFEDGAEGETQGKTFLYWDAVYAGNSTVTDNMVVTAVYETEEYTVKFWDSTRAYSTQQTVAYGEAAVLPPAPTVPAGQVFLGWSSDEPWWRVDGDMDVYPIVVYKATAVTPLSSLPTDNYGQMELLELESEDGASIYYVIEPVDDETESVEASLLQLMEIGDEPEKENGDITTLDWQEYTEPLLLTESCTVRTYSAAPNKNDSEIVEISFTYDENITDTPDYGDIVEVGTYNVVAHPGEEITLNVKVANNPGLLGYLFFIEADRDIFFVDYDMEGGFNYTTGAASAGGTALFDLLDDSGWQIMWFSSTVNDTNDTLFSVTLTAGEEIDVGSYPITVSYSTLNTVTENDLQAPLTDVDAAVGSNDGTLLMLGDINGDGAITNADVIRLARHVIDLTPITGDRLTYCADVNKDGQVTAADIVYLSRVIVQLESL